MPSVTEFIKENAGPLAELVSQRMVPLHDPKADGLHRMIARLLRSPKGPQGHIVTGAAKALRRQKDVVFANAPGTGKMQPNHCKVMTPDGWVEIGSLKVGDVVTDPAGGTANVIGVFPHKDKECLKVTCRDGASTLCGAEHLWMVKDSEHRGCRVVSTADMVLSGLVAKSKRGSKYFLPIAVPTEFRRKDYAVNPYLLGVLLGDGCLASGDAATITSADEYIISMVKACVHRMGEGVKVKQCGGRITWRISAAKGSRVKNILIRELERMGLAGAKSNSKFIPREYMEGDVSQRTLLLNGLLDTDGYLVINTRNKETANLVEYVTVSKRLCDDVVELVQSLGGTANVTVKMNPKYEYLGEEKTGQNAYRVWVKLPSGIPPFSLPRKAGRHSAHRKYGRPTRAITSIEYAGKFDCTCIALDSANSLYITDDYIVTHNTYMSLATAHCYANGRPYCCVITCPPHITEKWEREIRMTIPDPIVIHIDTWKEWLAISKAKRSQLAKPTFIIAAISKAKMGAGWIPAVLESKRSGGYTCPHCYAPVMQSSERLAGMAWIRKAKRFCPKCKSALWQSVGNRYEGSRIAKDRMRGFIDFYLADEAHGAKSGSTLAGAALGHFIASAKKAMLLTGTLIAGKSEDLRPTYFRLIGKRLKAKGIGWSDAMGFARKYGRCETVTTVRDTEKDGVKAASKKDRSRRVRPGIMPALYTDFIADRTLFLSLKEMGEALPKLDEKAVPVDMPEAMAAEYHHMKQALIDRFQYLMRTDKVVGVRFLAACAEALMTWPDDPDGWGSIGYKDLDGVRHEVYQPRPLDTVYHPKEGLILDMVKQERAEKRQCWVFSTRNSTSERLHEMFIKHGITANRLTTQVSAEEREKWIGENAPGLDVIISHPKLVETGLDLFSPGFGKHGRPYNMCTLIWAATGLELNTLRQASARHWRIGQTLECRTRFLYYRNTAQQNAITLMAKKLLAAEFLEGNLQGAGLIEEATEASMELAIVRQLAAGIQSEVTQFTTVA